MCYDHIGEFFLRHELVQLIAERITLIEENFEENQGTDKSYVDNLKQYLVFEFRDYIILEVFLLSYNEIWKKKKFNPWFIRSFKILEKWVS